MNKLLLFTLATLSATSGLYCPGPESKNFLSAKDQIFYQNFNPQNNEENNKQLLQAVSYDNTDFVRALLELGVSPNIYNGLGLFPLHMAIQNDNPIMVRILIDFEANPNAQTADNLRLTPLHIAAHTSNIEIVTLLLGTQTIDPSLQNSRGEIPLATVRGDNTKAIKEAFEAYKKRFEEKKEEKYEKE